MSAQFRPNRNVNRAQKLKFAKFLQWTHSKTIALTLVGGMGIFRKPHPPHLLTPSPHLCLPVSSTCFGKVEETRTPYLHRTSSWPEYWEPGPPCTYIHTHTHTELNFSQQFPSWDVAPDCVGARNYMERIQLASATGQTSFHSSCVNPLGFIYQMTFGWSVDGFDFI